MAAIPEGVLKKTARQIKEKITTAKKDWKTSLIGIVIAIIGIAYLFSKITTEQLVSITTFLIATGLIASQDGKKEE